MILRELPDDRLAPRPGNEAFRAWFYARWGRENAVVTGTKVRAEFAPFTQALSVKRALGGTEEYLLPGRRLAVDERRTLVLGAGATYGARIAGDRPVTSFAVFFRPGLVEEVAAAARMSRVRALDQGDAPASRPVVFEESLRPADGCVAARLDALRVAIEAGEDDEAWLEERLQALAAALLGEERGWRARAERLSDLGRAPRIELLARVDRATDHLLTHRAEAVTLDDLAAASRLSKCHLLRAFRAVHGTTPMAMLARERTQLALRLLADPELSLEDVAARSGFGSRQTLFRQLRRHRGAGGSALRQRLGDAPEAPPGITT